MHDAIQWGTLILVGFGILLNRYDVNGFRKEVREEISTLRKDVREEISTLRKELREEISGIRASVERQTTTINNMLFNHHERIAVIETKIPDKH